MQDKGKGNFYRMSTGILDYGTKCKRQLLEKHLNESKLSFKDFLKKHQHILYHLCFNRKCSCKKDCYLPRNKVIRPQQLEILFERKSATRLPCHKGGPVDFCCCDVQQNANVEDLDFTFVHCILVNCCVDEFWNCCLTSTKLEPFLNKNKHDIFHLWMSTTKCSLCGPNYTFPESNLKLYKQQWEILYSPAIDPRHATANIGIKIKHMDHELACAILNILCPLKVNVEKLTKIRNTMYGHATKGEIDQKTFKEKWEELKKCLLYIAKHCNKEKEFIEDLENLRKRSLDAGLCEEFRISLLRSGEEREVNIIQNLTINNTCIHRLSNRLSFFSHLFMYST